MSDYLISKQAAIDALSCCQTYLFDSRDDDKKISLEDAEYAIEQLPSTQPDLSGYSDRLWKAAYERGKAEAQTEQKNEPVGCGGCKYDWFGDPRCAMCARSFQDRYVADMRGEKE